MAGRGIRAPAPAKNFHALSKSPPLVRPWGTPRCTPCAGNGRERGTPMTVAADTSAFAPPMSHVERARAAAARVRGTALTPLGCADTTDAASDACLMERVAEGDRGAMKLLFTRHHLTVYRFVLRLVGNSATAEDIVSDVFIGLWRHAASFEGRAKLSTWILAIARNRAVSATRGRINQPLEDAMLEAIPDQAPTADETLAAGERSAILRQCLEK